MWTLSRRLCGSAIADKVGIGFCASSSAGVRLRNKQKTYSHTLSPYNTQHKKIPVGHGHIHARPHCNTRKYIQSGSGSLSLARSVGDFHLVSRSAESAAAFTVIHPCRPKSAGGLMRSYRRVMPRILHKPRASERMRACSRALRHRHRHRLRLWPGSAAVRCLTQPLACTLERVL